MVALLALALALTKPFEAIRSHPKLALPRIDLIELIELIWPPFLSIRSLPGQLEGLDGHAGLLSTENGLNEAF
jgi:hypothetical protein